MKFITRILLIFYSIWLFVSGHTVETELDSAVDCIFPYSSLQALESLYNYTNGDNWKWKSNSIGAPWDFSEVSLEEFRNPCSLQWQGITCTYDNYSTSFNVSCDASSLTLSGYKMQGSLPPALTSGLPLLKSLVLSTNAALSGSIPANYLHDWPQLRVLDLSANSLTGRLNDLVLFIGLNSSLISLQLNANQLSGSISESFLKSVPLLQTLDLTKNNLTGTIPHSLAVLLPNLVSLSVGNNFLNGSLPQNIFTALPELVSLSFQQNQFTGALPSFLPSNSSRTMKVETINGFENFLSGQLSLNLSLLDNLTYFELGSNWFSGELELTVVMPSDFNSMSPLQYFSVYDNHLTGPNPIPFLARCCHELTTLYLGDNFFSGQLNDRNGVGFNNDTTPFLFDVRIGNNLLTGTISNDLLHISSLKFFIGDHNQFSHSLPAVVTGLDWSVFSLSCNQITGNLPLFVGAFWISLVDLHNNYLTSTEIDRPFDPQISPSNTSVTALSILLQQPGILVCNLQENFFSGTLPSTGTAGAMQYLRLDNNLFTGTLPIRMLNMSYSYRLFNVSTNLLTGNFPSFREEDVNSTLWTMDISNNRFDGRLDIGVKWEKMNGLLQLKISNNMFSGGLDFLVENIYWISIDVSDNIFSGSLPKDLFTKTPLLSFAAGKNCLTGTIPEEICDVGKTLQTLALDGLHSSPSCSRKIFPQIPWIRTYAAPMHAYIGGSIPECLFTNMSRLQTLHLSGNGLTGTLPDVPQDVLKSEMNDLSLAYNQLTGTIPEAIQKRQWYRLDLSFNRLGGTLHSDLFTETLVGLNASSETSVNYLSLNNNRLSGNIPQSIQSLKHVDLISGNIFYCEDGETVGKPSRKFSRVPTHDPFADSYQCGSNAVNNTIYLWLEIFGFAAVILACFMASAIHYGHVNVDVVIMRATVFKNQTPKQATGDNSLSSWISTSHQRLSQCREVFHGLKYCADEELRNVTLLGVTLARFRTWTGMSALLAMGVFLPAYGIMSIDYSTFWHKYAWSLSAGFLQGWLQRQSCFFSSYRYNLPGIVISFSSYHAIFVNGDSITNRCDQHSSWAI